MMIEKRSPVKTVLIYVLLIVLTIVTLLPLVWMLSASFKLSSEVFTFPIKWIPETFHWENYVTIWQKINLATYTFNSFKLSIIITLIQLITSSFAAYGFSKCRFPGRNGLFLAYIATIAPEKIVIYSSLTPDTEELRKELSRHVDSAYVPELIHVRRIKRYMMIGMMIRCLQYLKAYPDKI